MSSVARFVLPAFLRRDWAVARAYRAAFFLQIAGLVGSLAVFFFIGRLVDERDLGDGTGIERGYFAFVVVGLAVLEVLQAGLTAFAARLREEQVSGTLEALMASPVSPTMIVVGSGLYEMLRATLLGVVVIVLGATLFGADLDMTPTSALASAAAFAACVALICAVGIALAAVTIVVKKTQSLLALVVAAVALLGGVYYPVEVLPAALESIAAVLPFTWGLDALRAGLLTGSVQERDLIGVAAAAVIALPLALWLFRKAVDRARREGSLTHF